MNETNLATDISGIPLQDIYGNYVKTNGGAGYTSYTSSNPNAPWNSTEPTLIGGSMSGYGTDSPFDISAASINAADYRGKVIRSDTTLRPQIYVIAVIGYNASDPPDTLFLQKLANYGFDQETPRLTRTPWPRLIRRKATTCRAPDPSRIAATFQQVAAQIGMRLAH